MSVKMRQNVERKIARRLISDALKAGYSITVNDGGEDVLKCSKHLGQILAAMFSTDEDRLFMHREDNPKYYGWVHFVYGNDGWDVVNDYTINLEPIMYGAEKLADLYS